MREPLTAEEAQGRLADIRDRPGLRAYEYDRLVRDLIASLDAARAGDGLLLAAESVRDTLAGGHSPTIDQYDALNTAVNRLTMVRAIEGTER